MVDEKAPPVDRVPRMRQFAYQGERPAGVDEGSPVADLFWAHSGSVVHKWHHYFRIYDRHFGPFRGRPFRMLEIGVSKGGSLAMWRKYFGPEATIFGIDIDPKCAAFDGEHASVRIGSQDDPDFLRKVVEEMGGVDVVLDDGSHDSVHIRKSFETLYPLLADGGVYFVEDLHAAYWPKFSGGYESPLSFMNDVKTMIDDMHHWYHSRGQHIEAAANRLAGLHIYDSIVVLDKAEISPPRHTKRGAD